MGSSSGIFLMTVASTHSVKSAWLMLHTFIAVEAVLGILGWIYF